MLSWFHKRTLCALATLTAGVSAQAAWEFNPSVQVAADYEDNVNVSENEESAIAQSLRAQLRMRNTTPNAEFAAILGGSYDDYSSYDGDVDLEDSDSQFLALSGNRKFQQATLRLDARAERDVLLRRRGVIFDGFTGNEILDLSGPTSDDIIDDLLNEGDLDVRTVEEQIERETISVSPNFSVELSERSELQASYRYSQTEYDNADAFAVEDNESHNASLSFNYLLSERDMLRVVAGAGRFEPDESLEVDTYELLLEWRRRVSETMVVSVAAGPRRTESDLEEQTGVAYRVRVDRNFANATLFAVAERSLYPSLFGEHLETDRISLGIRGAFSERLTWNISAGGYNAETAVSVNSNASDNEQESYYITPLLQWAATPSISVSASYTYERYKRGDGSSIDANTVGLALSYSPQQRVR